MKTQSNYTVRRDFADRRKGFTIIELTLAMFIIVLLFAGTVLVIRPVEQLKRGRDNKRISDLSLLDRAISEYHVDYGDYPDAADTLRTSTVLPTGNTSLASPTSGWIKQNLSAYTTKLPIDPLNDATYYYKYYQNDATYEINAKLEFYMDKASTDGGSDATVYELGNNLTLIAN